MLPSAAVPSPQPLPSGAEGYWKKAYDSLSQDLRDSINSARTGRKDILDAVLHIANQKREICIHKQWKVTLPKGQVVVVRDVIEKVAHWVKTFAAVGDVAIQFDTATAALPWAAVRFILQAAISDTQVEGAIVADLEVISRLLARYREFEEIHLKGNSSVKRQMEDGLICLYADILTFLAMTVGYFDTHRLGKHSTGFLLSGSKLTICKARGLKSVFRAPESTFLPKILEREAELLKIAGLSDAERLYFLEISTIRLLDQASIIQKALDEAEHTKLFSWLSLVRFTEHQKALSENRMPNSATWLFSHENYRNWKNSSSSSVLLLHGIGGSGKSNICSAVVDSFIQGMLANPLAAPMAYFYCIDSESEPYRADPVEVLRSILRQVTISNSSQPTVRDTILQEFERRLAQSSVDGMGVVPLNLEDCVKLILEVTVSDPITIILDALDTLNKRNRAVLVRALVRIVQESASVVKVFLTSRNDSQVFSLLPDDGSRTNLEVKRIGISREDTTADMKAYVKLQVEQAIECNELLQGDPPLELQELLVKKLIEGAAEMFQWVNVQIEYLCDLECEEDILTALETGTLAVLDDAYALVVERILTKGDHTRCIATRAFLWLLYMKETLESEAFLAAVFKGLSSLGRTRKDLTILCSNLILLDSNCNTFRFSHYSAQEFLRRHEKFSIAAGQRLLATSCLRVCLDGPSPASNSNGGDDLYQYAALYWAHHCSQLASMEGWDIIINDIMELVYDTPGDTSDSFLEWVDQIAVISKNLADEHPCKTISDAMSSLQRSPLFVASAYGLDCLLSEAALGPGPVNWEQKNYRGHTSLYLACVFGHPSTAQALLNLGADPNARGGRHGSPLHAACYAGHTAVIRLLLQNNVSVYAEGTYSSALEACSLGNHEEGALALLEHADTIRNAEDFACASTSVTQAGFLNAVEKLSKSPFASQIQGDDADDEIRRKILEHIQGGRTGMVAKLLNRQPNIQAVIPEGAVATAAIYGHDDIIELLAGMGVDLEQECKVGSPLRCAALMGREQTMRKLLQLGADTRRMGTHGTPLEAASMKGHVRIARLLLKSGVDVNQSTHVYGTALQAAAYHGHEQVVKDLLDAGAKVDVPRTGISSDALHAAVEGGHHGIVKLMLDRGFTSPSRQLLGLRPASVVPAVKRSEFDDLDIEESSYSDMFHAMSASDSSDTDGKGKMRSTIWLRHHLTAKESDSERGNISLRACASKGDERGVAVFLEYASQLRISPDDIEDALRDASAHDHVEVFKILFDALQRSQNKVWPSLQHAAKEGDTRTVSMATNLMSAGHCKESNLEALSKLANQAASQNELFQNELSKRVLIKTLEPNKSADIRNGDFDTATILMQQSKMQAENMDTYELLEAAYIGGHIQLMSMLLQGIDLEVRRKHFEKALTVASLEGKSDILTFLLENLSLVSGIARIDQALIGAAGNGHVEAIKLLLQHEWEGYAADVTTALAVASLNGHEDTVRVLLAAGAKVNTAHIGLIREPSEERFLYSLYRRQEACYTCYTQERLELNALQAALFARWQPPIVRYKLDEGAWSSAITQPGWNQGGQSDFERVIKILLDHGADCNGLGGREKQPLIIAIENWSVKVVTWLIEAGADVGVSSGEENAVRAAVRRRTLAGEVLQRLLDAGASLRDHHDPIDDLLFQSLSVQRIQMSWTKTVKEHKESVRSGSGAALRLLLKNVSSISADHTGFAFLLQQVVIADDNAYVDLLLERGVDINGAGHKGRSPLHEAAYHGRPNLAKKLLDNGADPNVLDSHGNKPLHEAIQKHNSDMVFLLVSAGAAVNETCGLQRRPLIIEASKSRSVKIVQCLLDAGVSADTTMTGGYYDYEASPLHMACRYGRSDLVQLLLSRGANVDIEVKGKNSGTPLQRAANMGNLSILRLLLEAGADINRVHGIAIPWHLQFEDSALQWGETALCLAAKKGHFEIVQELLSAGAIIYENGVRKNALSRACYSRCSKVLELLLEALSATGHSDEAITEALGTAAREPNSHGLVTLLLAYAGPTVKVLHEPLRSE